MEQTIGIHQAIVSMIEEVKPYLQQHGGDLEFDRFEQGNLYLIIKGACIGCPFSFHTFTLGIERQFKEKIPSIKRVITVPE